MTHLNKFTNISIVHEVDEYALKKPKHIGAGFDGLDVDGVLCDKIMKTNPVTVYSNNDVRFVFQGAAGKGVFVNEDGEVIHQFLGGDSSIFESAESEKRIKGKTFLLGRPNSKKFYYHWVVDDLARLGYLKDAGYRLDEFDNFLMMAEPNKWQAETLVKAGVDLNKIVVVTDLEADTCDEFFHIEAGNGMGLKMNRRIPSYLNSLFSHQSESEVKDRVKLYVSRPKNGNRSIEGEEHYTQLLEQNGFTITTLDGLNVQEQVDLFRRADVVVAPHGGALTNLVYCRPGTQVVEIFGRHVYPFYYGLSELCGLDYHAILEDESDLRCLVNFAEAKGRQGNHRQSMKLPIVFEADKLVDFFGFNSASEKVA